MDPSASLWQAGAGPRGITSATFYSRFRRYLRLAGQAPSGPTSRATPQRSSAASLDVALPAQIELESKIGEFGRGERRQATLRHLNVPASLPLEIEVTGTGRWLPCSTA